MQVPAALIQVTVRSCVTGEVQPSNDTCMICPPTTYSYTPTEPQCRSPCPANANCTGGATLVPELGYWHSAPKSTYMAACPNAGACKGDRNALLACQTAAYMPPETSGALQVMPCLVAKCFGILCPSVSCMVMYPPLTLQICCCTCMDAEASGCVDWLEQLKRDIICHYQPLVDLALYLSQIVERITKLSMSCTCCLKLLCACPLVQVQLLSQCSSYARLQLRCLSKRSAPANNRFCMGHRLV